MTNRFQNLPFKCNLQHYTVTEVLGRRNVNTPWISIWSGVVSPPPGTNVRDATTGRVGTAARKWVVPGVQGPRSERLQQFKIVMDTAGLFKLNSVNP